METSITLKYITKPKGQTFDLISTDMLESIRSAHSHPMYCGSAADL